VLTKRSAEIAGLPELVEKLNSMAEAVESDRVYALLMRGANMLAHDAQDNAPYDEGRTEGIHLRDAIFASEGDPSKDRRGPTVIAGVNTKKAPHAPLVERGTSKMPAQPFWRTSITATRPAIAHTYAEGVKEIIEDAAKK
jgi:HK97 gp10 family phage protein